MFADKYPMAAPALKDDSSSGALVESSQAPEPALFEMSVDRSDLGTPDSFRYSILVWVLDERYDKSIEELKDFLEKPSDYPNFQDKITRYIHHAIDLIYAIKAKRSFPGINSLTRAKQQELREKFKEHFRELQHVLKTVDKIQLDLRIQDARSTIYVVKALWIAGASIVVLAFWLDIMHGLAKTAAFVFDDSFGLLANWLAELIGF